MPRPISEAGQLETAIVDLGTWKRRALSDGVIDPREGRELLAITERLALTGGRMARSVTFVTKVLTCADGMRSRTVREAWEARNDAPVLLDDYRADGPDAA